MACSIRQNAPTGIVGMSFFIHFIDLAASILFRFSLNLVA